MRLVAFKKHNFVIGIILNVIERHFKAVNDCRAYYRFLDLNGRAPGEGSVVLVSSGRDLELWNKPMHRMNIKTPRMNPDILKETPSDNHPSLDRSPRMLSPRRENQATRSIYLAVFSLHRTLQPRSRALEVNNGFIVLCSDPVPSSLCAEREHRDTAPEVLASFGR